MEHSEAEALAARWRPVLMYLAELDEAGLAAVHAVIDTQLERVRAERSTA